MTSKENHETANLLKCPNPECRASMDNFISRLETNIYGPDGQSGLSGRAREIELGLTNKVSRPWLIGTFLSAIGIMCVIFIPMISGAIKTIGIISDRSLESRVLVGNQADALSLFDERSREAHLTLLTKSSDGDKFIIERVQEANEQMRQHIDKQLKEMETRLSTQAELWIETTVREAMAKEREEIKKLLGETEPD